MGYFAEMGVTWAAQQFPLGGGQGSLRRGGFGGHGGQPRWDAYADYALGGVDHSRPPRGAAAAHAEPSGAPSYPAAPDVGRPTGAEAGPGKGAGGVPREYHVPRYEPPREAAAAGGAGAGDVDHRRSRYLMSLEEDLVHVQPAAVTEREVPAWLQGWNMIQYRAPGSRWPQFFKNFGPGGEDIYVHARDAIGDPMSPGNMQRSYYWAIMPSSGCGHHGFVIRSMMYPDRYLRMDPDGSSHIEALRNHDNAHGPLCWDVDACAGREEIGLFTLLNQGNNPKQRGHYVKVDSNRPVFSTPFHEEASCLSLTAYKLPPKPEEGQGADGMSYSR